ncbi:DNA polymerase-3 subunit epsilon [Nocardiopsis flavescens]|uniref:DNA polymerase-3 subunit epsilon n=1 Tax=Nocardiopsis flavescens TaxID=758803 RepID=A0A1M6WU64_9ACTN|nr:3'-5' exonuclease [Nocardiopsis flavescens]SHK97263.1 DNA polymerase-3 subunit epsilon [Nocardiopsis flavescens]
MSRRDTWKRHRGQAAQRARKTLANPNAVILDTETTGLGSTDQILEIGILTARGDVICDERIKVDIPIGKSASRIHGIRQDMLTDCPRWGEFLPWIWGDLSLRGVNEIVIYNAPFDRRMIAQSSAASPDPECHISTKAILGLDHWCAMHAYAAYVGDWQEWSGDYRWQRLPGGDHSAIGDCRATLKVLQTMAQERE